MESDKAPLSSVDWLKWLGDHRDGFLVGGAVLYGLGYLVWTYNAWRNHLGQLPALEFQYIVAGLIPGLIIAMSWAALAFLTKLQSMAYGLFEKHKYSRVYFSMFFFVIFLSLLYGLFAITFHWLDTDLTVKQFAIYIGPFYAVVLYLALIANARRHLPNKLTWAVTFNKIMLTGIFCWTSLAIYIQLYPHIPQEFGGPQPRCAFVDLVHEDIAPSTLSVLVPGSTAKGSIEPAPKVVESVKLNVYFSTNDYLLVRAASQAGAKDGANLENAPLYELRKDVIRAVKWCPQ